MDSNFQRDAEALIRGLHEGKVYYDEALTRYGELSARLSRISPSSAHGSAETEAMEGALERVHSTLLRLYARVFTVVSIEPVDDLANGSALDAVMCQDAYTRWMETVAAHQQEQPVLVQWAGRRCTAFFEGAAAGAAFGKSVLRALPAFKAQMAMQCGPLRLRVGVHSGAMLPAENPDRFGLDDATAERALELQRGAGADQMVLSADTMALVKRDARG